MPSSNPGLCHGSHASLCPNSLLNSSILIFPFAEAASAIPQSGCRWSTCGNGRNPCNGVSIEAATGLFPNVHSGYISTISSSRSTPRYAFSSASSLSIYNVAKPARLMLPRSPPLPFTHRICFVFPSSGSTCSSFELVFPPPKFVIRRSEPSRFDRYRSNSGASSFAATASSQRSSRNRSPLCAVMCLPLSCRSNLTPTIIPQGTPIRQLFPMRKYLPSHYPNPWRTPRRRTLPQRLPRHHSMGHIVIGRHGLPLEQRQSQMDQARPIRTRLMRDRPNQWRLVPLHLLNRLGDTILPHNRHMPL